MNTQDYTPDLTPVEYAPENGVYYKRDDYHQVGGIRGGKVRACLRIIHEAEIKAGGHVGGVVTASARKSPQMQIVARLAAYRGLPARLHTASGPNTPEMDDAVANGGVLVQHRPGYNSVICSRAEQDAKDLGYCYIPFGMEHPVAMQCTREQAAGLKHTLKWAGSHNTKGPRIKRIVVVLGSGMTAAGILWGLRDIGCTLPVVGVQIGADPRKRLNKHAPPFWHQQLSIITSPYKYESAATQYVGNDNEAAQLDPHYEAKAHFYVERGDLFWVVGVRAGALEHE